MTTPPQDDFRALFERMTPADDASAAEALSLFAENGLGGTVLSRAVATLARSSGRVPALARPALTLFAGTHGVARRGASATSVDMTLSIVAACGSGDAPVSHLCVAQSVGLKVYDLALHLPTGDIAETDAMDERTSAATMAFGMEAIAGGPDLLLVGTIRAPGADIAAAAVLAALFGGDAVDWLPAEDAGGADALRAALARPGVAGADPLALPGMVGGREIAALAGAMLAARVERLPVILEGLPALAAAAVLHRVDPGAIAHCLLASAEGAAESAAAARLGLEPILRSGLAAGEGTRAVLAATLMRDAVALHTGFAARARSARH